jgi:Phosphotransferase enzyme family
MSETSDALGPVLEAARTLVGGPIDAVERVGGGRNSRVFRIQSGGCSFALKQYPSRDDDARDRLATEVGALRLMERYHVDVVPRVVGVDEGRGFAILSWVDGAPVDEISNSDIDAAVRFLATIHDLRNTPWASQQPLAAEACLSGSEIERQIKMRMARLQTGSGDEPELFDFLGNIFTPAFLGSIARSRQELTATRLDFTTELPHRWRSLVPSDFGFHNSLRCKDGSLAFLDFEYFGWDDPVKLTADIMLHPGRSLESSQRQRFRRAAVGVYGEDQDFAQRLTAYFPLFGLRWVLIVLNEFIPQRWRRRVAAGAAETWSEAKAEQLALARRLLASLADGVKG